MLVLGRVRRAIRPERFIGAAQVKAWAAATVSMAPAVAVGWWVTHHYTLSRFSRLPVLAGVALATGAALALTLRRFHFRDSADNSGVESVAVAGSASKRQWR